jgi:hypothetical protein
VLAKGIQFLLLKTFYPILKLPKIKIKRHNSLLFVCNLLTRFFGFGYILVYLAPSMKAPKLNTAKNHMHQNVLPEGGEPLF